MEQGGLLDDILELTHIAGPTVGQEHCSRRVVKADTGHRVPLGKIGRELAGKQYDVSAAVAQRRHGDRHRREAVVQVFPETPLGHSLGHIDIGGGNDAHV